MPDATEAFSPLADDYARYRPGYPQEMYDEAAATCGLSSGWVVADVGSGTGNLARLFLAAGHRVIGIEPNREMREAGDRLLAGYPAFHSLDGAAERIPLDAFSVDLVTVGQALHWFDLHHAKEELRRILRGGRWVAVAWNDRVDDDAGLTREYRALTRRCCGTGSTGCAASLSAGLDDLFSGSTPSHASYPHAQHLDLPGLLGRARSSGYTTQPGTQAHRELTTGLTDLFHRYQHEGQVTLHYKAQLYVGLLQA